MRTLLVLAIVGACTGDSPTGTGGTPTCTGAIYDLCRDEHDCTSSNCRPFGAIEVCTQSCNTSDNPCPADSAGNAVTCDASMLCAATVANTCKYAD
jgi:hypothetical protein